MASIDLSADLGEGFPWDDALLGLVTSASVCCGAHAGDESAMRRALLGALKHGVAVGAHPGFEDREGFGRREKVVTSCEVDWLIRTQVGAISEAAAGAGVLVRFLKPHGALYNQAQRDPVIAEAIVAATQALGLPVLGQPGSELELAAIRAGVPFLAEGFVDRRYTPDGRLLPRSHHGAILDDPEEIAAQALRLVEQGVATLCLHGDNPESVQLAELVREALDRAGIELRSFA